MTDFMPGAIYGYGEQASDACLFTFMIVSVPSRDMRRRADMFVLPCASGMADRRILACAKTPERLTRLGDPASGAIR